MLRNRFAGLQIYFFVCKFCVLVSLFIFFSLCPVSPFFSFFFSRMVPPSELGPTQGFSLLNGSFSLPLRLPGGSDSGILPPQSNSDCKRRYANKMEKNPEIEWTFISASVTRQHEGPGLESQAEHFSSLVWVL